MFSYLICSYNPNIGKITAKTIPPTTTAKNTIITGSNNACKLSTNDLCST